MASLCGVLSEEAPSRAIIERMLDSMAGLEAVTEHHVGGELSVSTTQPGLAGHIDRICVSEDGTVTVAFAGYLYTEDLDAKTSPARHCLAGFRRDGLDFARNLNGTFAIVIHDSKAGKLHLISDRLSTRALYYCRQQDAFVFASEVKAILEFPGVSRKVNPERLLEFLMIETVLGCDTYYDHIRQVPPASILTWDGNEISVREYWRPVFDYDPEWEIDESAERIAAAITGAMGRICAGVDRAALMLSGGLDSRAVAAASPMPLHCVTMHAEEYMPEVRAAQTIASTLGFEHEFVRLPETYPLELLETGSLIGDGMHSFHHAQGLYLAPRMSGSGTCICLNGWAMDVFLGGSKLTCASGSPRESLMAPPQLGECRDCNVAGAVFSQRAVPGAANLDQMSPLPIHAHGEIQQRTADQLDRLRGPCKSSHDLLQLAHFANTSKYPHI